MKKERFQSDRVLAYFRLEWKVDSAPSLVISSKYPRRHINRKTNSDVEDISG